MMNCLKCPTYSKPPEERRDACIACSQAFTKNSRVRYGTNELSNKGQTIESYDNHGIVDDRDTVTEISKDYLEARSSSEYKDSLDEALDISKKIGVKVSAVGFDYVRKFVYEFTSLTDNQLCLLKDILLGLEKTDFARRHDMTPSSVNRIYQLMLDSCPIIQNYIVLTNGTLDGLRGRKRSTQHKKSHTPRSKVDSGPQMCFAFV